MPGLGKTRLLVELRGLSRRYPTLRSLEGATEVLAFEVSLDIDGEARHVRLTLPPAYPSVPPEVRELDAPGGRAIVPVGSMHRFPNGAICLFAHGNDPQVWHQGRLAVEAIERFESLVRREREQQANGGRGLYRDGRQIFLTPGIAAALLSPGSWGELRVRVAASGEGDLQADAVRFADHPELDFEDPLNDGWRRALPGYVWVPWINASFAGDPWNVVGASRGVLDERLHDALPAVVYRKQTGSEYVVLVRPKGDGFSDYDAVHFRRPGDDLGALYAKKIGVADLPTRLFRRNEGVIPARGPVAGARVVLVGLGSLGGAVAVALARAGIQRFVLIDPDRISIENVSRHVAPLQLVGYPKVEAIKAMLVGINPDIEVTTIAKYLAWDLPWLGAGAELEGLLAEGDIVVCTCAIGPTERQLNALCVLRDVPLIFGSALGAAEHARVFRVLTGESACYECVLRAQDREPERFPRFVAEGAPAEGPAYLDPSLPGLGIDVTQIAMLIARLTLQTIARTTGAEIGIADERGHHLLWSNRGGWSACDRGLQVAVVHVPRDESCPVCGSARADQEICDADILELDMLRVMLRQK